ncbi:MAG: DUF983 domain-containing protein [Planctomycetaceae bacterium]|nr:DUF983 domain-containing protein [Planctomycetaceae bacterium]
MPRPSASTLIARALHLRCPRCGEAKMFTGLFRMHETCPHCRLRFEREPGYFLGSIYINYGLTALLTAVGYTTLRFGYDIEARALLYVFLGVCVAVPIVFFRYARALWLALDCRFENDAFFQTASPARAEPQPKRGSDE